MKAASQLSGKSARHGINLADAEITRLLRRGCDPTQGLTAFQIKALERSALRKLRRNPLILAFLAAVYERRAYLDAHPGNAPHQLAPQGEPEDGECL